MNRFRTIDLCRDLLFIFMMSTRALSIAGVPSSHWPFSDFWLPNGWATLVFVVLSGYGVGFLFLLLLLGWFCCFREFPALKGNRNDR